MRKRIQKSIRRYNKQGEGFSNSDRKPAERNKSRNKRDDDSGGEQKHFGSKSDKTFKPKTKRFDKPMFKQRDEGGRGNYRAKKKDNEGQFFDSRVKRFDKPRYEKKDVRFKQGVREDKPDYTAKKRYGEREDKFGEHKQSFKKEGSRKTPDNNRPPFRKSEKQFKSYGKNPYSKSTAKQEAERISDGTSRLNKYVANSGICSRREADDLITAGLISVNGETVTQLGTKVNPGDIVRYNGETIRNEALRYVLLNKPKDFITTTDDPHNRRTVMELISKACKERVYPVGRLDRNTTGLLLFTNDGDLAKKLTHPGSEVQKIYHVELDRKLDSEDMNAIRNGVELEDGFMKVDDIQFDSEFNDKKQVGVEIHSGKNRIVRRIFEALGYKVLKLDRVIFAGLTKKDLPRGRWRILTDLEVSNLKMITGKMNGEGRKKPEHKTRFEKKRY